MSLLPRAMLSLCALIFLSPHLSHALSPVKPAFSSAEHVFLGDKIKLSLPSEDPSQPTKLHLPNGLHLTYGEIVSFGDFYGVVNSAISQGKTEQERKNRFMAAFNAFAVNPNVISEANQILDVIRDEQKMIEERLKRGESTEDLYKKLGRENDRKFNCITGGGCDPNVWFVPPGRYLLLANDDFDHFGENAWIAYKVGHELALEQAALAHATNDVKKLELAYAMNAFACHFLSDRFAAGHIRTPRQELTDHVIPGFIGSLLAGFMHDEEGANGLHVHNVRGDQWIAYGDKSYFNPKNTRHRDMINETLQVSADQIYASFQQGTVPFNDNVYTLVPQPDEMENASKLDGSPLFYWDNKSSQLMRRVETKNLYDRHWTSLWLGWATLAQLAIERGGLTEKEQAILALSGFGEQALQSGLITNKEMAAYIKRKQS